MINNLPKPFKPEKLPINLKNILDFEIYPLLFEAKKLLGEYNGFLQSIINPMLLINPILSQETLSSSKLEGTHATLEDVLNYDIGNILDTNTDEIIEILNYKKALIYALNHLGKINDDNNELLPLSSKIIKELHKILLNNVRGQSKTPGEFKRNQNYIGFKGEVTYTPVEPSLTNEYIYNLEDYIHSNEINLILQSAIIHAQFEMIHPFQDGNGRIGRLLIPLFLYYRDYISVPAFYMSTYFNENRSEYIETLNNISKNNDWKSWLKFYLKGVIISAKENTKKANYLNSYYNQIKNEILPQLNSKHGIELLDLIFQSPILTASYVEKKLKISRQTVYTLFEKLISLKILKVEIKDNKRKTYYCEQLLL